MTFHYNSPRRRCQDLDRVGREEGKVKGYSLVEHILSRSRGVKRKTEESRGLRRGTWPPALDHALSNRVPVSRGREC